MSAVIQLPTHGGQLVEIAERFHVPVSKLIDFSANINPDGAPQSVIDALRDALTDPATIHVYPDLQERRLRSAIANHNGIELEQVVVANGFIPLLDSALKALTVRSCLLPVPAFNEYRRALERAGTACAPHFLDQHMGFGYDRDELLAALTSARHDAILLANPQNPSGTLYELAELIELVRAAARLNIYVFLDEAFIDYAPNHSLAREVANFKNLVVFRSVTKFHGIPGLRVAYAVAGRHAAEAMQKCLAPWPITTLASTGVIAALADSQYASEALRLNSLRRKSLADGLESAGLYTYPAAANFLLLRFSSTEQAEACWMEMIANDGMVLRHCGDFEGLSGNHLRCAVRSEHENCRLIEAFERRRFKS